MDFDNAASGRCVLPILELHKNRRKQQANELLDSKHAGDYWCHKGNPKQQAFEDLVIARAPLPQEVSIKFQSLVA